LNLSTTAILGQNKLAVVERRPGIVERF